MAIGVYKLVARYNRLLAGVISLLVLCTLALLWPIPIHGGFTILGETLYHELRHEFAKRESEVEQEKHEAFNRAIDNRFAGPIEYELVRQLSGDWHEVRVSNTNAYYDDQSKMLWSEWIYFETAGDLPSLELAKGYCQQLDPAGYWALISEGENYLLWKSQGQHPLSSAKTSTVAQNIDVQFGFEMPVYALRNIGQGNKPGPIGKRLFSLRCVALTKDAPVGGYVRSDISLDEWNSYQLSKLK